MNIQFSIFNISTSCSVSPSRIDPTYYSHLFYGFTQNAALRVSMNYDLPALD